MNKEKDKNKREKTQEFWNERDLEERRGILKDLKEKHEGLTITDRMEAMKFEEMVDPMQRALTKYWDEVIRPQMEEERQQVQYDGIVEEGLPDTFQCPRCGGPVEQVVTKRGIHWKCQNREKCGWDTNRPFDFDREARERYIEWCGKTLKKIFPDLNFVTNFPYSPEMALTGDIREGKTNYDLSVFFMGQKLQRLRVELNQHLSKDEFYESKFCYVVGIPRVVKYLAKRKGLVVHYLVDEPKERILVSRMDRVVEHCPMEKDNFGNQQYFIPKDIRPLIVEDDLSEIRKMFMANLPKALYRNIEIL